MSIYLHAGAAVLKCQKCEATQRVEWAAGDPPIFAGEHCGETMLQTTHNDGETPLSEPCPSYCCSTPV